MRSKTFNAGVKVGLAIVERKDMQYLYRGRRATSCSWISDTYDQIHVRGEMMGDAAGYLAEGGQAQVSLHDGVPDRASSSRRPWCSPSRRRIPGSRATRGRAPTSPRHSRPASSCRCRCSLKRASGSRSTRVRRVHRAREGVSDAPRGPSDGASTSCTKQISRTAPSDVVLTDGGSRTKTVPAFAAELVLGVAERLPEIDLLLEEHAEDWTVARMAAARPDDPASGRVRAAPPAGRTDLGGDQRSDRGGDGALIG